MKRALLVVVVAAVALGAYLYWTSDDRQIRRLLDSVAEAVSQEEGAGVAGLAEVASLNRYLAPDVTLEPGEPFRPITGGPDVVSTVGRLRAVMTTVQLDLSDVKVEIDSPLASAYAVARLTLRDRDGNQRLEVRDVLVALEKRDAGWVITAARALRLIASP